MLSVSVAWNVHVHVHEPSCAMAKCALRCQTICASASLGCMHMLLGRDDNEEWGTVNSSSLSFEASHAELVLAWHQQGTDSTFLVIRSFILMCSCQHSCRPPGLHTCRVLCWTQGIKLGLIFCWIFLGRDCTWQQTGMSNRVMQRRAPGTWQHLGERPSAAGPGARAHHKFYSWATKHEETLLVQNHHKTNRPEVRTARENRRGRREGRIKLLQKPSNCTCKTFIWHYSWKSQSRFTKMSMDYSPLLWIQGINLFNASYCAWQWASWMEIPMLELRAEEDLPQKPWGTWPGWAYHVEQVSMSSLWLLVPGISQHFELVSDIQTVRKKKCYRWNYHF